MNVLVKALCGILVVIAAGCARDKTLNVTFLTRAAIAAPQPPPVFTTPAALLLTNQPGFSSMLAVQNAGFSSSGSLFARNARLRFLPDPAKTDKNVPEGRYSFLWDVSSGQGWVLSDALQGYAPMTLSKMGQAKNIRIENFEGGPQTTVLAEMSDGTTVQFVGTSERGAGGVPSEIRGGNPPFQATFSKVSLASPEPSIFEIPPGFTAYPSAEAMVDELADRFRNLKRKSY